MGLRDQQAQMRQLAELEQQQAQVLQGQSVAISAAQSAVLIALAQDVEKIRTMPTFEQRAEYKRNQFLPKWLPFVEQHFNKGDTQQNDVIGYCLVYLFDVGDFEQGLALAEKAIANGQSLPDKFKRHIPAFVADFMLNWTEKTTASGQAVEPYFSQVLEKVTTQWEINEVSTALWFKQAAIQLTKNKTGKAHAASVGDPMRIILAIQLLRKAFSLNHKSGVITLINRCYMRLNALVEALEMSGLNAEKYKKTPANGGLLADENQDIPISEVVKMLNSSALSLDEFVVQEMRGCKNV